MNQRIDVERLRKNLKDYYGTAMFGRFSMAMMDLTRVERASDEELIRMAEKNGMDLRKYYK
jgi:hypothetical protein